MVNRIGKMIYIAPLKALCQEKFRDWKAKFEPLQLECRELTGDSNDTSDFSILRDADIIVTTPEKWDRCVYIF